MQKHKFIISCLLLLAVLCPKAWAQAVLPTFSTDSEETWYYILFHTGNAVLQGKGESANLLTPL